jgi:hypothetical protein
LLNGSGSTPVSEAFTNDEGRAEFRQIPVGMYHVVVTGEGIEDADSGMFEVDRRKISQDLFISVHSSETNSTSTVGGAASIATVNLKIPAEAKREFDNASKAIAGQDWPKALQKLNRAIMLYPSYAVAYNNLGVVYGHTNEPKREREALENAVSLDDHFVAAKVNLAKPCLREHDSAEAEKLLQKFTLCGTGQRRNPDALGGSAASKLAFRCRHRNRSRRTCHRSSEVRHSPLHSGARIGTGKSSQGST